MLHVADIQRCMSAIVVLGLHNRALQRLLGVAQACMCVTLIIMEEAWPLEFRPPYISRNTFYMQLYTSCKLPCPLSGTQRLSAITALGSVS